MGPGVGFSRSAAVRGQFCLLYLNAPVPSCPPCQFPSCYKHLTLSSPRPPALSCPSPRSTPLYGTSCPLSTPSPAELPPSCPSSKGRRYTRGRGKGLVCRAPSVLLLPPLPTPSNTYTHRAQHQQSSWQRSNNNNKRRRSSGPSSLSCPPLHRGHCQPW